MSSFHAGLRAFPEVAPSAAGAPSPGTANYTVIDLSAGRQKPPLGRRLRSRRLERLLGFRQCRINAEEFIELGNLEDFVNLRIDIA